MFNRPTKKNCIRNKHPLIAYPDFVYNKSLLQIANIEAKLLYLLLVNYKLKQLPKLFIMLFLQLLLLESSA